MQLKPHNQTAVDNIKDKFSKGCRSVLYISGVGTGKSYVTMSLLDELYSEKKILYVIPKISIGNHLLEDTGFLKYGNNITFVTFNSFSDIKTGREKFIQNDIVIIDEAHHIGSELYGKILQQLIKENITNVLGLTATPEREDGISILDFFEDSIHGITNFEAIEKGLMPKFEYLICTPEIDKKTEKAEKIKAVINYDKSLDLLTDIINSNQRSKWICFFNNIKELENRVNTIKKIFSGYEIVKIYSNNEQKLEESLEIVRQREKVVILSCDMLLEGIHIDSVDGIILFRNVRSLTTFQQILGRTCSIGKKINPLVIDCTEVASRIFTKLLYQQGYSDPMAFANKTDSTTCSYNLMEVSLCNKRFFDVTKLLWMINSNYYLFEFRGIQYETFTQACSFYGKDMRSVSSLAKNKNMTLQEGLEYSIVNKYCDKNALLTIFRGKTYSCFEDACKEYSVNAASVLRHSNNNNITKEEALEYFLQNGLKTGSDKKLFIFRNKKYKNFKDCCLSFGIKKINCCSERFSKMTKQEMIEYTLNKRNRKSSFIVDGIEYKTADNFAKLMGIGHGSITTKAKKWNITKEEAAKQLLYDKKNKKDKSMVIDGVTYSSISCCIHSLNMNHSAVKKKSQDLNISMEEAIRILKEERCKKKHLAVS